MSHPTPEPADSEPCSECATGYLLHQEYGFADIPAGWTPVQRHDICGRYEGDGDAAEAAARDKGGVAVAFFMADPHYSDLPGDYADKVNGIVDRTVDSLAEVLCDPDRINADADATVARVSVERTGVTYVEPTT
jgi:hypothetical protein